MLYHFTSSASLLGIVKDKALFATHIEFLNDTGEHRHGVEIFQEVLAEFLATPGRPNSEIEFVSYIKRHVDMARHEGPLMFLTSFAGSKSLAMFRMYCAPNDGYCLGVSRERLSLLAEDQGFELLKCIYHEEEQSQIARELIELQLQEFRTVLDERNRKKARGEPVPSPPERFYTNQVINFTRTLARSYFPLANIVRSKKSMNGA
jgi:hypothetical protein